MEYNPEIGEVKPTTTPLMKKMIKVKRFIKKYVHPRVRNLVRSPSFEFRNIQEDLKSYFGQYSYPYRAIFIAGLPKSGSTWAENFFAKIEGYVIRPLSGDQDYIMRHGIPENGFKYFPKKCYSSIKTHADPTAKNFQSLEKNGIEKVIVIYRDPRDVAVSRYFHLCKSPKKPWEPYYVDYNAIDKNDALKHSIEIIKQYYFDWIEGWLTYAKQNPDKVCVVRYEDMYYDTVATFQKMVDHYELNLDDDHVIAILDSLQTMKKGFNDNRSSGKKSTFRKGGSGDWRNHFTKEHIELFSSEKQDLLRKFGYQGF